jgi:hypothetical protein
MHDRIAILPGILTLILGVVFFLTPEGFKVQLEIFPMTMAGVIILAIGTFLFIMGTFNRLGDYLSKQK